MSFQSPTAIKNLILEYLDDQNWMFLEEDDLFIIPMGIDGKVANVVLYIQYDCDHFVCYTKPNLTLPPDAIPAAMQFITCANYGLRTGNFELDQSSGDIRYKSFAGCEGSLPDPDTLKHLIDIGPIMFSSYGDALINVIENGADPIAACRKVKDSM